MHSGPNTGSVFGHIFDFSGTPAVVRVFLLWWSASSVHHLYHHRRLLHRQVQDAPLYLHHATMLVIFGLATYSTKGVSFGGH